MTEIPTRLAAHLARRRLFGRPGIALLAVSGGADSVALLDLLAPMAPELGLELVVAHVDHGIRADSRSVGQAVRRRAETYGLPFELGELKLGPDSSETSSREARWAWLRDTARRIGARYIVTAHHLDDQIETVLLRVLRGSGTAGLAGMAARTRSGVVRPLLPFRRADLAAYVTERGLPFHDDPANRDPRHLRSWIRTELLPQLEQRLGARVSSDLARLARHAARERRAWAAALEAQSALQVRDLHRGFEVARGVLAGYDKALSIELLRAAARKHGLLLGPRRAARLVALAGTQSGRRLELGQGWVAEVAFDRLKVSRQHRPGAPDTWHRAPGTEEGAATVGDYAVRWQADSAPERLTRTGWTTWIPAGGGAWQIRGVRAGDRLRPLGGTGHRSVRRLLMEARVPRSRRGEYPVVARGSTILWVPGICRAEADLPGPGTRAVRIDVTES